jgi:putative solute:sodium symporter small subunit
VIAIAVLGGQEIQVCQLVFFYKKETRMQLTARHQEYWSKNLRITGLLLALWFFVTFVLLYFSRDLTFGFFGWPFSFWVAAQGALIVYCLIIWFYARYMNNLDKEYGVAEGEES